MASAWRNTTLHYVTSRCVTSRYATLRDVAFRQAAALLGWPNGWNSRTPLSAAHESQVGDMLDAFDIVGMTERFAETLLLIARAIGMPYAMYKRMNQARDGHSALPPSPLPYVPFTSLPRCMQTRSPYATLIPRPREAALPHSRSPHDSHCNGTTAIGGTGGTTAIGGMPTLDHAPHPRHAYASPPRTAGTTRGPGRREALRSVP